MAISKNKKQEILEKTQKIFKNSNSVVFVNFHGLNVSDTTQLRNNLREEDSLYTVTKKTLVKKALEKISFKGDMPELGGELALAYGSDSIAPARGVYEFQKKNKENIAILGGIFEGSFVDQEKMLAIAQIPSLQVLRGQFVNVINSPIQGFVIALSKIADKKL